MRALLGFVALALASAACDINPLEEVEPGHTYLLHVDEDFSSEERTDAAQALADWRTFTGGALAVELTDGPGDVDLVHGGLGFSRLRREIRVPREQFDRRQVLANIVGQFAGMQLHDSEGVLCRDGIGPALTDADRDSCRSAGFCQ